MKEEQRKREGNGAGALETTGLAPPTSSSAGPSPTGHDPEGTTMNKNKRASKTLLLTSIQ